MQNKIYKNAICLLFTNPYLTTLRLGLLGIRVARSWIWKFVNNKQMVFLQIFVSQQLLFSFSKNLDTMSNVTDWVTGRTDLWVVWFFNWNTMCYNFTEAGNILRTKYTTTKNQLLTTVYLHSTKQPLLTGFRPVLHPTFWPFFIFFMYFI